MLPDLAGPAGTEIYMKKLWNRLLNYFARQPASVSSASARQECPRCASGMMPFPSVWRHGSGVAVVKTTCAWFLKPYTRLSAASDLLHSEEPNATWFQKPCARSSFAAAAAIMALAGKPQRKGIMSLAKRRHLGRAGAAAKDAGWRTK
jgi:hypothetical protein